ncbi:Mct1 malonyl-CoA acyl carrier protein acyltransferase [Candida orthopsilosis Co 90-125]|uniref:[acyl-carrier-protein] S-malonyltransferase n=1 Tax=Candida orthopsilosis (strain 90-125) TaxID=1136231 RepID=H8X673_CANO9|nr:Mct1 malonyl-CoA acyl carrier protein acyltransferase [Candida orthopsilosis Co 90-125]CCG23321.1 Mct1 malonyl-CoA acyl carrier protein acyltransferase [Candida orthopsilosis Co 90-125]
MKSQQLLNNVKKYAITCPGQGILRNGLLEENKNYRHLLQSYLDEIDTALSCNFSQYLFQRDVNESETSRWLRQTSNAQPAILASTYITLKVFEKVYEVDLLKNTSFLLGHSLGEYTALALSGIFDLPTAVQFVRERGRFMEEVVRQTPDVFGMIALIIRPEHVNKVLDLASEYNILGNVNSKYQVVISGELAKLDEFVSMLKSVNKRMLLKAEKLPVSIPFHSTMLETIVPELRSKVDNKISAQRIPIISNLDGEVSTNASKTVEKALNANYKPVQWMKSMNQLTTAGVDTVFNLGPGKTLNAINKRYNVKCIPIENIESFTME